MSLSQRFADVLFETYPEWRECARFEDDGEILMVEVPCPSANADHGLYVRVDDEITIGLDMFHTHFWQDEQQAFELAVEFLADLLGEKLVVLISYDQTGKWAGSKCQSSDAGLEPPELGQRMSIRSWHGTYDKEIIGRPAQ